MAMKKLKKYKMADENVLKIVINRMILNRMNRHKGWLAQRTTSFAEEKDQYFIMF